MPEAGRGAPALVTLRQTLSDLWAAQVMELAAALAFYAVLSVFPLLLAGAALASWAISAPVVTAHLSALVEGSLPPGVVDLDPIVSAAIADRGRVGLFAIILWLLSGRRIFGALVTALDRVSDVDARQETVTRRAWVEVVSLFGVGLLFVAALVVRPLLGVATAALWGPDAYANQTAVVGALVHGLLLVIAFLALYLVVPHGDREIRAALPGAVVATGLVLLVRASFSAVLGPLWASYALLYGPLALAALLLTWSWLMGLIVLFGAGLASHVKVMMIEGRTPAEAETRHVARKRAV